MANKFRADKKYSPKWLPQSLHKLAEMIAVMHTVQGRILWRHRLVSWRYVQVYLCYQLLITLSWTSLVHDIIKGKVKKKKKSSLKRAVFCHWEFQCNTMMMMMMMMMMVISFMCFFSNRTHSPLHEKWKCSNGLLNGVAHAAIMPVTWFVADLRCWLPWPCLGMKSHRSMLLRPSQRYSPSLLFRCV